MVNAVDGTLYLKLPHISVPGHIPLDLVQYYTNKSDYSSWFGSGMSLNYSFAAWINLFSDKKRDTDDKYSHIIAESPGGSIIRCLGEMKNNKRTNFFLDPEVIHKGFTNTASSISAKTNLKNTRIKFFLENAAYGHITCYLPDGSERQYYANFDKPTTYVYAEKRLNKTELTFDYHYFTERLGRLGTIERIDSIKKILAKAHGHTFNWLTFSKSDHHAKIASSNGKSVQFRGFERDDNVYIHEITSSDNPKIAFDYCKAGKHYCISRVKWPENRFLEIDYDHKARVTALKAPVGANGDNQTLYRFYYHDQHTDVVDANNHTKVYNHKDDRVLSIDDKVDDTTLYRSQVFYWGAKKGHSWGKHPEGDEGNLLGYATLNHERSGQKLCHYDYDKYGNITKETLYGNLSGTCPEAFGIDDNGLAKDPHIEQHHKYYKYSNEQLLIEESKDFGPKLEYRYKHGTDLMWAKFVKDGDNIVLREFYEYNAAGILIEKIVDDGITDNKSCLDGVTERLITDIIPNRDHGLPQDVWENYYDLASERKVLLKHTHYNYNRAHQVSEEALFDCNNNYCYSIWYEYDHKNRLHKKTNPLGQTVTYTYDENGNKHYEKLEGADYHTLYEYDTANRCTKCIEYHYDDTQVVTEYQYDCMGNKTASKDRYGQTTHYTYDHCNRLAKTVFPDGSSISKEYDIFDNVTRETNQNGAVTSYRYTIRNMPSHITYADGAIERFEYNLNGTLAHKWDKSGTQTSYEYDLFDRVKKITLYDTAGNQLSVSTNVYNALHLLETCDPMGLVTHFRYDHAGRKIEQWQEEDSNYSKITYEYDNMGRLARTKRFYGSQASNYIADEVEYDALNRPILERQVDDAGNCLHWSSYEYDLCGNCTRKRTGHLVEGDDAEVRSLYNSKQELIESTDEVGSTTTLQYSHGFSSKTPLQKITTDALKNSTEEYYDIFGRVVSVLRKNPTGDITASSDFEYSPNGKKTKQIERVLIHGQIDHDYIISWEYDLLDRVTRQVEQPNTPDQKVTAYTYDLSGRIATIIKPDATVLQHTYDALGRLVSLASSDNTISNRYSYDLHNNPIKIEDKVSGLTTTRTYDLWNHLTSDGIEDQFSLNYQYDALGRLTSLLAPDTSSVQYSYTARLDAIARYSPSARLEYKHRYTDFDKAGRVIESELIHNVGSCNLAWDKKGRNSTVQTKYFSQSIPTDGFDAVGNLKTYSFSDAKGHETVACNYDDLYQLTEEKGIQNLIYAHDSLNNRLSKNSSEYRVDAHNKITSDGLSAYVYDKNGNLIQDAVNSYSYDALGRLTAVKNAHGTTRYIYDSFNRRIKKNDAFFLYQGMREIGTLENGTLTEFRVLGLGKGAELGASVAIELNGTVYCPIHDFRGNIVCLVDTSQHITESYRYTAFGECEVMSHRSMPTNPWRFASKRYDPETGFSYFLIRYYSPSLGRWITPDPLGFADGPNMYAYVHNNPMTKFDLHGLYVLDAAGDMNFNGKDIGKRNLEHEQAKRDNRYNLDDIKNFHGPFPKKSFRFIMGSKQLSKGALCHINGINNSPIDAMQRTQQMSNLADGRVVQGTYNRTHTLPVDLLECLVCHTGIKSTPADLLAEKWNTLISRSPPDAKFFESCHSGGADHLKNALTSSSSEIQQRIIVLAIAPSVIIPNDICYDSFNYISQRDFVTYFDVYGMIRYRDQLKILKPHPDAPSWDHDFLSPTFDEVKEKHIDAYIKMYGGK